MTAIRRAERLTASISTHILGLRRMARYLLFVWEKVRHRRGSLDVPVRNDFYYSMWRDTAGLLSLEFRDITRGYIEIGNNHHNTVIHQNLVLIDHPLTVKIARNKPFVLEKLNSHGITVPPFLEYSLREIGKAEDFLSREDTCVVKPAMGAAGGDGVSTNVTSLAQLRKASIYASLFSHNILIEKQIEGDSYRLLYLNGELLDAIRRNSPGITGDGTSTIRQLMNRENERRKRLGGSAALTQLKIDQDCLNTLRRSGLTPNSRLPRGNRIVVKQAANDNSSNENEPAKHLLCNSIIADGERAASIIGVSLAGVDLITTDPGRPLSETGGIINEVNTTPGLHYHYQVTQQVESSAVAVPILKFLLNNKDGATNSTTPKVEGI